MPTELPAVLVCHVCRQPYFLVRLRQQILRSLGVAAQLVFICLLRPVKPLVGLNDVTLSSRQIAVPAAINVHDRRLGEESSDES